MRIIFICRLNEGNTYETMIALVGKVASPFFKSYVKETGRGERDGDKLTPTIEKNLNEVEVALLHLQQNIDIPEINLAIHPNIQAAVQKASKEGRKAKVGRRQLWRGERCIAGGRLGRFGGRFGVPQSAAKWRVPMDQGNSQSENSDSG